MTLGSHELYVNIFMRRHPLHLLTLATVATVAMAACGPAPEPAIGGVDHRNVAITIEGRTVQLVDGVASTEAAPGSAARIVTRYFGGELRKDLDGDEREDVAFLVTQETGGSGTFFYLVAALATESGYRGSAGVLLGDRIAPQTTESGPGRTLIVNYADRAPGEPLTTPPSQGRSLRLLLDPATLQFGEVAPDFEGEADPARMSLEMTTWRWIRTDLVGGGERRPRASDRFTLRFAADGSFAATTDCNSVAGGYSVASGRIAFNEPFTATRMFCADSQEAEFTALLAAAESYRFTSRGELVVGLDDGGSAVFR